MLTDTRCLHPHSGSEFRTFGGRWGLIRALRWAVGLAGWEMFGLDKYGSRFWLLPGVGKPECSSVSVSTSCLVVRSNAERSGVVSGSFAVSADMGLDATSMKIPWSRIRFTHRAEPYCEKVSSSRSSGF